MDDPQSLIQHGITLWNARDREGFTLLVDERVENLAYGVQKRVDVARAVDW